jgi:hypothetical protein
MRSNWLAVRKPWTIQLPEETIVPQVSGRTINWEAANGVRYRVELLPLSRIFREEIAVVRQVKSYRIGYRDQWEGAIDLWAYHTNYAVWFRDVDKRLVAVFRRHCAPICNGAIVVHPRHAALVHLFVGMALSSMVADEHT